MTLDGNLDAGNDLEQSSLLDETEIRARRRALGAYYTPDRLSSVVTSWAIQAADDRVLEPGFGGCGFLLAAKVRLESLGQTRPHDFIHGCDVDDAAFGYLKDVFNSAPSAQHFPNIDFMDSRQGDTWGGARFKIILGNPPYVSYQTLGEKRLDYQKTMRHSKWPNLSARASLWAYFVLHALSFLERGGRVAWVLPGSLIRADYSRYVKENFKTSFRRASLFHVHERLFTPAGAGEETVVLVAEGYEEGECCSLEEHAVETVEDLATALANWRNSESASRSVTTVSTDVHAHFSKVPTVLLGDLLSARIGLVTGDNSFFLFSKSRAEAEGIDLNLLHPVFTKGAMAPGLNLGKREVTVAKDANRPCFLLSKGEKDCNHDAITRYLERYPQERIAKVSTFKKRKLWHETIQSQVPDAFWPVMRDLGPKLILNPQKIHCTNTIHRIFFSDHITSLQRKQIAICVQTSYAQLHAEMSGRSYGSGVLKHEPRDVERIRIPWPKNPKAKHVSDTFRALDQALQIGDNKKAMQIADRYVRKYSRAYTQRNCELLQARLNAMRIARMPIGARSAKQHPLG
ncbi:N-6 DNA methylase [uncultured Xanthomonas sp.]|uniref:N-6 DNA methylase n=1 Tax=uncultured Xanthomonas sp. TaxID=152831 RepID=UPI0025E7115F|nr:N-6 DNA methylase [uncultured Xanthomonas sp.]